MGFDGEAWYLSGNSATFKNMCSKGTDIKGLNESHAHVWRRQDAMTNPCLTEKHPYCCLSNSFVSFKALSRAEAVTASKDQQSNPTRENGGHPVQRHDKPHFTPMRRKKKLIKEPQRGPAKERCRYRPCRDYATTATTQVHLILPQAPNLRCCIPHPKLESDKQCFAPTD